MTDRAIVVFGDVVSSRMAGPESSAWLRWLRSELDARYAEERLAPFGFTQGDELQGVLRTNADPLEAVLVAALREDRRPMRWAVAAGEVEPGPGPATERTGVAFLLARDVIERQKVTREGLVIVTGEPATDALLRDIAPVLARLLAELTVRQRRIAGCLLVGGKRQADVAAELNVTRATVSVVANRAWVREIAQLRRAISGLVADAVRQPEARTTGATAGSASP